MLLNDEFCQQFVNKPTCSLVGIRKQSHTPDDIGQYLKDTYG